MMEQGPCMLGFGWIILRGHLIQVMMKVVDQLFFFGVIDAFESDGMSCDTLTDNIIQHATVHELIMTDSFKGGIESRIGNTQGSTGSIEIPSPRKNSHFAAEGMLVVPEDEIMSKRVEKDDDNKQYGNEPFHRVTKVNHSC